MLFLIELRGIGQWYEYRLVLVPIVDLMSADGRINVREMRFGRVVAVDGGGVAGCGGAVRLSLQTPHHLPPTTRRQTRLRRRSLTCQPVMRPFARLMRPGTLTCELTGWRANFFE